MPNQQTYYRRRRAIGVMTRDHLKRLKEFEKENARLERAEADLALGKLIKTETAKMKAA